MVNDHLVICKYILFRQFCQLYFFVFCQYCMRIKKSDAKLRSFAMAVKALPLCENGLS